MPYPPDRVYNDFSAGVVDTGSEEQVPFNGLWAAENITLDTRGSMRTRLGTAQFLSTIGGVTRILGLHAYHKYSDDTWHPMMIFNDDLYIESSSTWSAQSESLTGGEANFLDAFDKVYINNGTDSTRIYDGNSVTTDSGFKKGPIMAFFENRIIVAIGDEIWFTDLATTTFQATSYINLERKVTGLLAGDLFLYVFTEDDTYKISGFIQYDGVVQGAEAMEKMSCHVGTICHRSLHVIKDNIYTLTKNGVYRIENQGRNATRISEDCESSFDLINQDYLYGASAAVFDDKYYLTMRETGVDYNNVIFVFDTTQLHQSVFGTDDNPTFLPAFYKYTYDDAVLYPEVLAVIPSSTIVGTSSIGAKRLMFGCSILGKTFQMETGTDDDGGDLTSFAEKPLLTYAAPGMRKRLMKVQHNWRELGTYNVLVAFKTDEFATYSDETVDLTPLGAKYGTAVYGVDVYGGQTSSIRFKRPHIRGYFFMARIKSETADEPWECSRIVCMYRVVGRLQPAGAGR